MSQVPNLSPQNSRNFSGWPSSASKTGYTQFLKRVVLVYVFLLCPLSACISSLGDRNWGLFYFVTFVTIILAVFPLIYQSINKPGGSVSSPPIDPGNQTPGKGKKKKKRPQEKDHPREGRARVINAFEIRPGLVGAGCVVTSGILTRSAQIRVLRRNTIVFEGNIESLRCNKVNISEIASGDGCSIVVRGFSGFEVGDIIATFGNKSEGKKPEEGSGSKGDRGKKPPRAVVIPSPVTVKHLAELLHLSPNAIIKALTKYEIFADVNQVIDYQRAAMVAKDLGYIPSLRKG